MKKALGYYVPDNVVDQMAKQMKDIRTNKQIFQGTCLCTDAERYTSLSEIMAPDALGQLMNQYFTAIFKPVKKYNGTVSEVVADSMIAIWPVGKSERSHRLNACLAALAMVAEVERFNQVNKNSQLPTRIGLHTGQIMIGNIGAMDRYEYNPIGDIVNTASRIEGLNKYLGTRILTSEEVVAELDMFLTRELGRFVFAGKTKPVVIHELLCVKKEADQNLIMLCNGFKMALDEYKRKNWEYSFQLFSELLMRNGNDGPSQFYMEQCRRLEKMPKDDWEDIINLNEK
jgi:adenylate cyclase